MAELLDLKTLTPDVSKAAYLERMLDHNTASYKYYWFKGILDEVCAGHTEISFTRLVARMAAGVWYPVVFFRLRLGAGDALAQIVDYLQASYGLPRASGEADVIAAVEENVGSDARLAKMVAARTKNVPYRILRPFYTDDVQAMKQAFELAGGTWNDGRVDTAIFQANRTLPEKAIYGISHDKASLTVTPDWVDFLRDNELIIRGWLDFRLTRYLQARNPSVPAISMKLRAPVQRDLSPARRYWKCAMELCALKEIYTGFEFKQASFDSLGQMSVDHFIPWSFVLHNEAWDLVPMFKNANSSKNDRLPNLEKYLDPFCNQQFDAMIAVKEEGLAGSHAAQFDSLRSIDADLDHYARNDASRQAFSTSLRGAIVPLYQIALNQGYDTWTCEVVHTEGNVVHNVVGV